MKLLHLLADICGDINAINHDVTVEYEKYCNTYLGYVPTKDCFNEKSDLYEASLCYHSNLVPEAAEILTNKAIDISKKLFYNEVYKNE